MSPRRRNGLSRAMSTVVVLAATVATAVYATHGAAGRDAAVVSATPGRAVVARAATPLATTPRVADPSTPGVVSEGASAPVSAVDGPRPWIRAPEVDCTPILESGYRRGRRAPITLVRIDGKPIERTTANAYLAMREAAADDGVELVIFSAFRSQVEQEYFYACYRDCSCNGCSPAAKPGFSNHQMGRAVDIGMWPGVHEWLTANAKRFGFVATVKREPWHWELRAKAKPPRAPACPVR